MQEEEINGIIDREMLKPTPLDDLPENAHAMYRAELDPNNDRILIVEIVWKRVTEGMALESIVDRRIIGKVEGKGQFSSGLHTEDFRKAECIAAYINAHRA